MSKKRQPYSIARTGVKGCGKTYQNIHTICQFITPRPDWTPKKVVIFDTNYEYTAESISDAGLNYPIKTLALKDVPMFAADRFIEARRVLPLNPNGAEMSLDQKEEALAFILKYFRRGLVVAEDINTYMLSLAHNKEVLSAIVSGRHKGQDVILSYQSLSALDPRVFQNTAIFYFHYQTDDISRYADRISCFDMFRIAQLLVEHKYHREKNERFFVCIMQFKRKIKGNFSQRDFAKSCMDYIIENPIILKKESLRYGGDKIKAMRSLVDKYMVYYGN